MSENRQFDYDVAFSFAGEDRLVVERIALELRDRGLRVFYDDFEKSTLWGKVLYDYLADLYSNRAKFCVIFASASYKEKRWTNHERQSAQERAFKENREYILPVRIDDTEIPGLLSTIGFLDLRKLTEHAVIEAIIDKLTEFDQANRPKQQVKPEPSSPTEKSKPANHVKAIVRVSCISQEDLSLSELQKRANKARFGVTFPDDYGIVIGCPFSLGSAQNKIHKGLQFRYQIPSQMKPYSGMKCEEELLVRTDGSVQLTYEYSFDGKTDPNFALELYFKQLFYTLHFSERLLLDKREKDINVDIEVHVPVGAYLFDHFGFVDTEMQAAFFSESLPIQKKAHVTLQELQSKTDLVLRLSNAVLDGFEYDRGPKGQGIPGLDFETVEHVIKILKSRVSG